MKKTRKSYIGVILLDILCNIIGTSIMALGIHMFTAPNHIAPGGVSGIATLINYLFSVPLGLGSLLLNVPLFILSWVSIGKAYTLKSLLSAAVFFFVMDYGLVNIPTYTENPMLAAIFGGVLMGLGLGIVFLRNSSTGGTDILGKFLQKKYPHISLGRLMLYIDAVIVVASMFVFDSLEVSMYAIITIFVTSKLIDAIIYGSSIGKLAYIISDKTEEIAEHVIHNMDRGATFLKGMGAYSKKDMDVLICAIRSSEFPQLKRFVHEIDPLAFLIVTDANEVFGEGFKAIKEE